MTLHDVCGHLLPPHPLLHVDTIALEDHSLTLDVAVTAPRALCSDCTRPSSQVHSHYRRTLTVRPQEPHEALMANRNRQPTPEFKTEQARRCGIEGTRLYGIRTCGMRRVRYTGLAKTHLQHGASAAVMNLARMVQWLGNEPRAHTRQTPFQRLQQAAA
jgi:transposase